MDVLMNAIKFHKDRLKEHVAIIGENVLAFRGLILLDAKCNSVNLGPIIRPA